MSELFRLWTEVWLSFWQMPVRREPVKIKHESVTRWGMPRKDNYT
jgi:hypothetical protein